IFDESQMIASFIGIDRRRVLRKIRENITGFFIFSGARESNAGIKFGARRIVVIKGRRLTFDMKAFADGILLCYYKKKFCSFVIVAGGKFYPGTLELYCMSEKGKLIRGKRIFFIL